MISFLPPTLLVQKKNSCKALLWYFISSPSQLLPIECFWSNSLAVQLMAEERHLEVDLAGFERCMQEQKERGRKARKTGGGDKLKFEAEATSHLANSGVARTDDQPK